MASSAQLQLSFADVEWAVEALATGSAEVQPGVKQQALEALRMASLQGWAFYTELSARTASAHVRFWCMSALLDLVKGRPGTLDDAGSAALHAFVLGQIGSATEAHAANKLAALFVALARKDYPAMWPTAFTDVGTHGGDAFGLRVLSLLVDDYADDDEASAFLAAFVEREVSMLYSWANGGPAERAEVLAGLAAYLPNGLLLRFPFPTGAERYGVVVKLLGAAGSRELSADAQAQLRLELMATWPCLRWTDAQQAENRESVAEMCCTVAETYWSIVTNADVHQRLRTQAWEALKVLLPTCLAFYCVGSRDFRIADSLEEFFSLLFSEAPGDARSFALFDDVMNGVFTRVLGSSMLHFATPAWLGELDPDSDDYKAFYDFRRDVKGMLRKMIRYDRGLFQAQLRQQLLAMSAQRGETEMLEGGLCILCEVVRSSEADEWRDVIAKLESEHWIALPAAASFHAAVLDVLSSFVSAIDGGNVGACVAFVVQCIVGQRHVVRASHFFCRLVSSRLQEVLPAAAEAYPLLESALQPGSPVPAGCQQVLCQGFGAVCSGLEGAPRATATRTVLVALARPMVCHTAAPAASLARCVANIACFMGGVGSSLDPTAPEWAHLLESIGGAVCAAQPDETLADALASLGWKAQLPPHLLMPFFARVWGHVTPCAELHLGLALRLVRDGHSSEGVAADFIGSALPRSVDALDADKMASKDWNNLFELLEFVAARRPHGYCCGVALQALLAAAGAALPPGNEAAATQLRQLCVQSGIQLPPAA